MMEIKNINSVQEQAHIRSLVEDIKICICSLKEQEQTNKTRPVGTSRMDEEGCFWFLCNKQHYLGQPVQSGNHVELIYSEPGQSHLLTVYGTALVERSRQRVKELWRPMINEWFTNMDDPNILLIKIIPTEAYYWNANSEHMVALVHMAAAA